MKIFSLIILLPLTISFNIFSQEQEIDVIRFSYDEFEILNYLFSLEENDCKILINPNIKYSFFSILGENPKMGKPSILFTEPCLLKFKKIEINLIKKFIGLHLSNNQMIIDKSNMQKFEFSDDFDASNNEQIIKEKQLLFEFRTTDIRFSYEEWKLKKENFLKYYIKRKIITISRIAFNENRDTALLYYYQLDPLSPPNIDSGSRYVLLKKIDEGWSIEEELSDF